MSKKAGLMVQVLVEVSLLDRLMEQVTLMVQLMYQAKVVKMEKDLVQAILLVF